MQKVQLEGLQQLRCEVVQVEVIGISGLDLGDVLHEGPDVPDGRLRRRP
ncbi:hypothetical protein ABZ815_52250 [Nonomuraea sp. NPDC047529]